MSSDTLTRNEGITENKNMTFKKRIALIGIILSMVAGLISGIDMIGEIATTPNILIVFFSGVAGGASLVSFIRNKKNMEKEH